MTDTRGPRPASSRGPAPQWKPVLDDGAPTRTRRITGRPSQPLPKPRKERKGYGIVFVIVLVLALMLVGGWAYAYHEAKGRIDKGTIVAGVDIGGMTPEQAVAALTPALQAKLDEPVTMRVDGASVSFSPADAGLSVDVAATVAAADVTSSAGPSTLWSYYTGGDDVVPVVALDPNAFAREIKRLDRRTGQVPHNGSVAFTATGISVVSPRQGLAVDPDAVHKALLATYLASAENGGRTSMLTLSPTVPTIGPTQLRRFLGSFANKVVRGPVKLKFGAQPMTIPISAFGDLYAVSTDGSKLTATLDPAAFKALVQPAITAAARPATNATVAIVNGQPQVVAGQVGQTFSVAAAQRAFERVVTNKVGSRTASIPAKTTVAAFSTADARRLHIRDLTGTASGSTDIENPAPHISLGSLNSVVLAPGGQLTLGQVIADPDNILVKALRHALHQAGFSTTGGGSALSFTNTTNSGVLLFGTTQKVLKPGHNHHFDDPFDHHHQHHGDRSNWGYTTVTVQVWGR
jgi:hypothetical protein